MYTESSYEEAIIELFQGIGYDYIKGQDVERELDNPLYIDVLEEYLYKINKQEDRKAIEEALNKIKNFENASLVEKNIIFMDYLQNGVPVRYFVNNEEKNTIIYLVDYKNVNNNSFIIANQWTVIDKSTKKPDIVLFLNGLPVVVMELKSPSRETTDVSEAYRQLRNYIHEIESLFVYNAICVMSDQLISKAGTITSSEDRFMEWKTKDGSYEDREIAKFDTFFVGMFEKERLLDIIKNFICFFDNDGTTIKILSAYHQYFAVKKAIEKTKEAVETKSGKGGVFWHTQGSGKSLSMVFYTQLIQKVLDNPTIIVITDRNDLDEQLFTQFSKCKDFLRQKPLQAESRKNLKELLISKKNCGGIIFTTMQKFEESDEPLSTRNNIIVITDEAHRGQYGLNEEIDFETGRVKIGTARIIRDNLPNAIYLGFTGTPISLKDRDTREVFGDYIDIYDMTQSVKDGATRPIYYESRVIKLQLDQDVLRQIDEKYNLMSSNTESHVIEKSKKELSKMEALLGNDNTIDSLVKDIIDHYENYRQNELTGKAMIVAYSRSIAIKIYKKILELRPTWNNKVKVVMTSSNNDPEEWLKIIGNQKYKQDLAIEFKKEDSDFKIAIVVDMWLTGFDVPSLATMYVYKPMVGHNLMQAIARVNRVFKNKEGGLIVDYIGIANALKQAMADYTLRDKKNYSENDIKKVSYPKFLEKLEVCRNLFHGYNYSNFINADNLERAQLISGGCNFIISNEENKNIFIKESLLLKQAMSLCSSIINKEERFEAAFFDAIRTLIIRLSYNGQNSKISLQELNKQINELLKQSIKSEGVINLFKDIKKEFSLFDPNFIEEISKMKEKNIAVEILKKLINEQVSLYKHKNLVKSEDFSEKMKIILNKYLNGMLTNEEVIQELIKLAKNIKDYKNQGVDLGLSEDEMAFYDALTKPQAIKDYYQDKNKELISLVKELTETLRNNKKIDWYYREDARAKMRIIVKKLLKKYSYPPEKNEGAVDTVLQQCQLWLENDTEI